MRASQYKKKLDKKTLYIAIGILAGVLLISVFAFFMAFRITSVEVVGNTRYTDEEVEKMALKGPFSFHSLIVIWQDKYQEVTDIPFIESFELERISNHKIRIHVKEKLPVGYVKSNGQKLYFDKDGTVVEIASDSGTDPADGTSPEEGENEPETVQPVESQDSGEDTAETEPEFHAAVTDVPLVEGLETQSVLVGEKLPVENEDVSGTMMGITRMVDKFEVIPDKVVFDESYNATLYYGNIRVLLGQDTLLEEKIARVAAILPKLSNEAGELHLEEFTSGTTQIIFSRDNVPGGVQKDQPEVVVQGTNEGGGNGGASEEGDGAEGGGNG